MQEGIPTDAGVAEVSHVEIEDGVAGGLRPVAAFVEADGEVLGLADSFRGLGVAGGDGDETVPVRAEAAGVAMIDDDAAGEDHGVVMFGNGNGKLMPVEEVSADGVAPAHVSPLIAVGVVLKEEVVLALEEDEAVGIVRPVF